MGTVFKYMGLCVLLLAGGGLWAQAPTGEAKIRKVVIDAGHGGDQPGAVGKKLQEKNIVLNVALKTGALIRELHPDVQVIYTRETDVSLELHERTNIANRHSADLFISIHTNSVPNRRHTGVGGYETYVMGASKFSGSMSVAMQENAVITYETDYTTKYQGYDPKNPESFIIFSLLQNAYLEQSLLLASLVQGEMDHTPIKTDRGVKQDAFLVLWKAAMPSILIELAFISNPEEEALMGKESTLNAFAKAISNAFTTYKEHQEQTHKGQRGRAEAPVAPPPSPAVRTAAADNTPPKSTPAAATTAPAPATVTRPAARPAASTVTAPAPAPEENKPAEFYAVQIMATSTRQSTTADVFKSLDEVRCFPDGKVYKYTVGKHADFEHALLDCFKLRNKYPGAFVVRIQNDAIAPLKK